MFIPLFHFRGVVILKIKVKGSYSFLREFCQTVKIGVNLEINHALRPQDETWEQLHDDLLEMFHYNAAFLVAKYPVPLNHMEVISVDDLDEEMVEWAKTEPGILAEILFIQLAEKILEVEIQKIQSQIAA